MKKSIVITICFLLIISTIFLSGCQESILDTNGDSGPSNVDYINVEAKIRADFLKVVNWSDDGAVNEWEGVSGVEIEINVNKSGDENKTFLGFTDSKGKTTKYTQSFKLYKDQSINIFANLNNEVPDELRNFTINNASEQITWEEVFAEADFGETFEGTNILEIIAYPQEYFE
jgi:hypothetical protein